MSHQHIRRTDSQQTLSADTRSADTLDVEYAAPEVAVVAAIAAVEGVDITAVDPRLHETFDTDALRLLAVHHGTEWTFAFDVDDHSIAVHGDGTVVVDDTAFSNAFVA
ncbi:HalOD1 output domain-containing protein [Halobaculum marinum]|uniref:HalOD1 output domain-containing protein n=1 Tax=Halobaculum marinum TaxID=3031996 RepID=A0ABD5WUW3_9EURY|nr:HalOD1 output domain-containing protein [Halobaculum sp. DT55]